MNTAHIDPDLARQLDAAGTDEPVEAVLLLRAAGARHGRSAGRKPPSIDAAALMRQARRQDGHAEMHYMPRLGALVVRARARAIRGLLVRAEVAMASANRELA